MELCKEYKSVSFNEECQTVREGFELDYQVNLPQYLDDIEKVIKCSVNVTATDYDYQGSSIVVYGKAIICITYKSAESGLLSNIFEEDFTKSFDTENTEAFAFAKICITTKYNNFHLINQRRLDIHTSLGIKINIFNQQASNCLAKCECAMLKEYSADCLICKSCGMSGVEFEENMKITEGESQIKNIINCFTDTVVDEYKIIKDKMLVKGTVTASVLYENINGSLSKTVKSFTFSKIIEASSIDENDIAFVEARLSGLYIKARADENNALCLIELVGKLMLDYRIYHIEKLSLCVDSYVPKHNSRSERQLKNINKEPTYYYDDKMLEIDFDSDSSILEIIDLKAEIKSQQIVNSKLSVEVSLAFLYYDEKNNISYYEKSETKEIKLNDVELSGASSCTLKSYDYVIKSSNNVMLRADVEYSAYLYSSDRVSLITDIDVEEELSRTDFPQLTLYFADDSEEVWDIAKKFSTSQKLIIDENNLSSGVIDGKRILLIPGM